MVNIFQKKESKLDEPIDELIAHMRGMEPDSEEYAKTLSHVERLVKLQCEERGDRINMDTVLSVAGNLLGILTIVAYEQKHVMVSKALGFVQRSKQANL